MASVLLLVQVKFVAVQRSTSSRILCVTPMLFVQL